MTLLTIAEGLAKNVGLQVPDIVASSTKREWQEAVNLCNLVGVELSRRVDWGALHTDVTMTGDGTDKIHALGTYFSRVSPGVGVRNSDDSYIRPLTRAEWGGLLPYEGIARYYLLEGKNVTLWPYLGTGETATVSGQTKAWCSNGTDEWMADSDTSLIDETLMLKGLIVRWRRQKGMDYADYEAEYEATLDDLAGFDDRARV